MVSYRTPAKYIRDYPGDGHTIVLLHGFLASKTYWRKLVPVLKKSGHRVIAIDLLGFGASPKPKSITYSYEDHIAHIKSVLERSDIEGTVSLVGHSMGGLLALRYARLHPREVASVCLLHPPIYQTREEVMNTLRDTGYTYRFLLDSGYRHVAWVLLRKFGPFSSHSRYSREGSLKNVIAQAAFFKDLKHLKQPLLLVVGKADRKIYRDNLEAIKPGRHMTILIEETGHHSPITRPTQIGARINEFIARNRNLRGRKPR